jgi:uncharacterized membrane protein YeaQ/YmgE (transglycosylase-associated protein family)
MTTLAVMFDLGVVLGLLIQFCIAKKDAWGYIVSSALCGIGALLGGYIGYALHLYPLPSSVALAFSMLCGGLLVVVRQFCLQQQNQ